MKHIVQKDLTSRSEYVFIPDSSSTVGAGLTGLAFNTSSLSAYYVRTRGTATAISLASITALDAYTSGGFCAADGTNMPGVYRLDVPDEVFGAFADKAIVMLKGAANMPPILLEYQLVDWAFEQGNVGNVNGNVSGTIGGFAGGSIDAGAFDISALLAIRTIFCIVSDSLNAPVTTPLTVELSGEYGNANDAFKGCRLVHYLSDGTFVQTRNIVASVNSGITTLHVDRAWLVTPQDTDQIRVYENDGAALLAQDLVVRLAKNTAFAAFPFKMVSSSDHVAPATAITVTAQRSIDGGAFAACANPVVEISAGWYKIDLAAADLNGDAIALKFGGSGADQVDITILTQPGVS